MYNSASEYFKSKFEVREKIRQSIKIYIEEFINNSPTFINDIKCLRDSAEWYSPHGDSRGNKGYEISLDWDLRFAVNFEFTWSELPDLTTIDGKKWRHKEAFEEKENALAIFEDIINNKNNHPIALDEIMIIDSNGEVLFKTKLTIDRFISHELDENEDLYERTYTLELSEAMGTP